MQVGQWQVGHGTWQEVVYLDDGVLALDAGIEALLLEVDDEIARLEVSGDGKGEIEVANGLAPLVRQRGLLPGLGGAGGGLFGGRRLWEASVKVAGSR